MFNFEEEYKKRVLGDWDIQHSDGIPLFSQKHPFWPGKPWYFKVWKKIQGLFVRPKLSKEAIETKYLAVLHCGYLDFKDGTGEQIPYREIEGIGYQWFRESDKTWQPLKVDGHQIDFINQK